LENSRDPQGMTSLVLRLPLGPQKTAPNTKFRNPADFVNQLAFLTRVRLLIPHRAVFRFPVSINPRRKCRNGRGYITDYRRHPFHLLALELPKITLLRPATLVLRCIPSSIPMRFGTAHQFNEGRATA
jgi:hypothetical protein